MPRSELTLDQWLGRVRAAWQRQETGQVASGKRQTGRCGQPFRSDARSLHIQAVTLPDPPPCHQRIEDGQPLDDAEEAEHQEYVQECLRRFAASRKAAIDAKRSPTMDYWEDTEEDDT